MMLKKYVKSRRKVKVLLLLLVLALILISLLVLSSNTSGPLQMNDELHHKQLHYPQKQRSILTRGDGGGGGTGRLNQPQPIVLKSPIENGVIMPEKYNERVIKERIMQEKLQEIKQQESADINEDGEHVVLTTITKAIHIFYNAPVQWYKAKKPVVQEWPKEQRFNDDSMMSLYNNFSYNQITTARPSVRILNTAFYPALGLYKPTESLLQKHLENIKNCGIGVIILAYTGASSEIEIHKRILDLVPKYNISVTFEISMANNQSIRYIKDQLTGIREYFNDCPRSIYRVYSMVHMKSLPIIYVNNAYKLADSAGGRIMCHNNPANMRDMLDAFYIGHIRQKTHADSMRRMCFDGFYSKLPSNGATFASTWKNWSYLKSFALTYKLLFIPTVGPGFAERNKFPRHGDIQRHRSNGRYYGVAWRTAIINHVGFINIASYNNWQDGSQIEEVIPKAGFLDYNPGSKSKYLDLTTHWVGNFLKTRKESLISSPNCYEFINNTIC